MVTAAALSPVSLPAQDFHPPGPGDFVLEPLFAGVTKPMLQLVLAAALVFGFFWLASRRAAIVPGRLQYAGEQAYGLVRNTLARDIIGSRDYQRFVPYLVALFFFILVNNLFGLIPFVQFPTISRVGYAYGLALLTWLLYNGFGVWRHGLGGYLKHATVPPGVPKSALVFLAPLEFISNILVRPFTLSLRLFANMFAGHLLLLLFALGGEYLLLEAQNAVLKPVGVLAFAMAVLLSFLELLVQVLQAYIFTILTAIYIGGALAEEH